MQQNIKKTMILAGLATVLTFGPRATFAQAATTFSGQAVALRASVVWVSLALSDTGALPSGGGSLSTSLASVSVAGIASADLLSSSTSGSGSSSQSQSTLADVNLLNGLVTATVVKSNSSASCSNGQASFLGNPGMCRPLVRAHHKLHETLGAANPRFYSA
jgi:hypothetical protein